MCIFRSFEPSRDARHDERAAAKAGDWRGQVDDRQRRGSVVKGDDGRVLSRDNLPQLPRRRRLGVTGRSVSGVQFGKLLRVILFLLLAAQFSCSFHTGFLLLAFDLLAVDDLHGACHAFLFCQSLVLAVLVHPSGTDDEGADCPVGGGLDWC